MSSDGPGNRQIEKIATEIRGFDEILCGGLPAGRMTMINGGAGTGKTLLAMEFLYRQAQKGRHGVFVSFEERADDLRLNAQSMGYDVARLEAEGSLAIVHAPAPYQALKAGDFNLTGMLAILEGHMRRIKAKLLVLDAIDVVTQLFGDEELERIHLQDFLAKLRDRGLTVLLTVKALAPGVREYPFLEFLSDCVILLDQRVKEQIRTRRLHVLKYRGSNFLPNEYPYVIANHGMVMLPISTVKLDEHVTTERIGFDIETLDAMLQGGLLAGSGILLSGPSGSGKTTIACAFARAACKPDHKVLYVSFEQGEADLCQAMRSCGLSLDDVVASGNLHIHSTMPESNGIEEHLVQILDLMDSLHPRCLIVDAVSAIGRMGSPERVTSFIVRLLAQCRPRRITCMLTDQRGGTEANALQVSATNVASLVDACICLLFVDDRQHIQRRIFILKMRGSKHSHYYHSFDIYDDGIRVNRLESVSPSET